MSQKPLCCLCISRCSKFHCLFDKSGKKNRAYYIAKKYFDPLILDPVDGDKDSAMCYKCWQNVHDFYNFQQSVLINQTKLKSKKSAANVEKLKNRKIEAVNATVKNEVSSDSNEPNSNATHVSVFDIVKIPNIFPPLATTTTTNAKEAETCNKTMIQETSNDESSSSSIPTLKKPEVCFRKRRKSEVELIIDKCSNELKCSICKQAFPGYSLLVEHFLAKHPSKNDDELPDKKPKLSQNQIEEKSTNSCVEISDDEEDEEDYEVINQMENDNCVEISDEDNDLLIEIENELNNKNSDEFESNAGSLENSNQNSNESHHETSTSKCESRTLSDLEISNLTQHDDFIAKWMAVLKCPLCKMVFNKYSLLHMHFRLNHPGQKCHVYCCKRKLVYRYALVEHVLKHLNPTAFKCHICGINLACIRSLQGHFRSKHRDYEKTKDVYDSGINDTQNDNSTHDTALIQANLHKTSLQIYKKMRAEPDGPKFKCTNCNRVFNKIFSLKRHRHSCPRLECSTNNSMDQFSETSLQSQPMSRNIVINEELSLDQSNDSQVTYVIENIEEMENNEEIISLTALNGDNKNQEFIIDNDVVAVKEETQFDGNSFDSNSLSYKQNYNRSLGGDEGILSTHKSSASISKALAQTKSDDTTTALFKELWICGFCQTEFKEYSALCKHFYLRHPNEKPDEVTKNVITRLSLDL